MRKLPIDALSILLALAGIVSLPAQAASFCVASQASFQTALTTAASNGQTNTIRVVAGNYALNVNPTYSTMSTNTLIVLGSYQAGCLGRSPQRTVLDGQDTSRPLFIFAPNANVSVEGFDFVSGLSTNNRGGGLSVRGVDVRVDLNNFIANRADDYGGGLFASATGELRVRNNLFVANSAAVDGAAQLFCNGTAAFVTNNTAIGNHSDATTAPGGIRIGGSAHYSVSNNILWNNNNDGVVDFRADSGHERLNNDIGTSSGTAADASSSGNLSVDPVFAPCGGFICFSFELARNSPLVDAGVNLPPGGLTPQDLLGLPRVVAGLVDIGAFELDELFADDFE